MQYAALTFWLILIVLIAWGVHQLWSGIVSRKVLNVALLPGTLVAQLGHVLGLLVTGAKVTNTSLYGDESASPETTQNASPKIPVVGPIIIALLPLLACAVSIYLVARWFGQPVLASLTETIVGPVLPTTLGGFWQFLHGQLTLTESITSAMFGADWGNWQTWVFTYLVVCFTVRIAPFPGNHRSALFAVLVLGVVIALVGSVFDGAGRTIQSSWTVLNLTVAVLLLLLLVSLLIRGGVGLVRVVRASPG
ncbi:MAG: hypothetical protein PVI86_03935 [Phycisphaerae bacterium]